MNKKKPVGRPPISKGERTVAKSITVLESHLAYLKQVGGDNLSEGVRVVTDAHMERYWPITRICPSCEFFIGEICTDLAGYVHSKTGNCVCRYNPYAVLPQKGENHGLE